MMQYGSCHAAPSPLEDYVAQFDDLFTRTAQRQCCRAYLLGVLLPRDRNKTLIALARAGPFVQAQAAPVQRDSGMATTCSMPAIWKG